MEIAFENVDLKALPEVARKVAGLLTEFPVVAFYGDMGAGKTTLIKAVCRELGVSDEVNSPTFSIVNEYLDSQDNLVFHFDFYRIKSKEEALDFGYEEYLYSGNTCLLEWPEKVEDLLPGNMLKIYISGTGLTRDIKIKTQ